MLSIIMDTMAEQARTIADALSRLATIREGFSDSYRCVIRSILEFQKPLVVCTIYYPPMLEDESQSIVAPGLSIINDTILRIAFEESLSVIEMRPVCTEESDFASIIEPSESGGAKIAEALAKAVGIEPASPRSQVFAI